MTKLYLSNVSIISILQAITRRKNMKFSWIFSSTSNDALVVKTKPDINTFLTPNLRHLSTMYLILPKRFSVFDWLLLFQTSFIQAWIRTVSGVYIFRFTSRYWNNCFDVVLGNNRCLEFPFFKALLKLYILNLLGVLSLKINVFSCSVFLLMRHYKIYHLEILVLWKMSFDFLDGF